MPDELREGSPLDHAHKTHPPAGARGLLRIAYWAFFVGLPFVLACAVVVLLTPPSGTEVGAGALGTVQSLVREQPVPIAIGCFVLFEMVLWSLRHRLPFAHHAHAPLRRDIPPGMAAAFERARALGEEANMLLEKHGKSLDKAIVDDMQRDLTTLDAAMQASPFEEEAFVSALVKADKSIEANLGRWRKSELREYTESILFAVAVALALRAFVVEAFKIPTGSMIPTLLVGDHIFVNKFAYGPAIPGTHARVWSSMPPERGDVMVFAFPENPEQDFIKRVIAIPGDKLEVRGGFPYINDWAIPHCRAGRYAYVETETKLRHEGDLYVEFLGDESYLTLYDAASAFIDQQGPYHVKPGEVWVMGDNRNNSHDSRMWWGGRGGGVPFENVKGRALFVWLSMANSQMDWSRLGAPVMGRPRIPAEMKDLEAAVEKCFRERPPVEQTTPPASK